MSRINVELVVKQLASWPSVVFFVSWVLALLTYTAMFATPSGDVVGLFLIYAFFLFVGDLAGRSLNFNAGISIFPSEIFIRATSLVLLAGVIHYIYSMLIIILSYPSLGDALLSIRYSNLDGNPVVGFYSLYVNAIQILFALGVLGVCIVRRYNGSKVSLFFYILCVGVSAIASLLDGSRSFFVMGILWVSALFYFLNMISMKQLSILIALLVLIFAVTFSIFRPVDGGFWTGMTYAGLYFSGGIGAFDYLFDFKKEDIGVYWQSLELLVNKLALIGLPFEKYAVQDLRNDFVYLSDNLKTNVFTSLGLYFWYLGYSMFIMAFIIGFLGGWLVKFMNKSVLALWLYPLYLCALVMSLFHDYYLSYGYYIFKVVVCLFLIRLLCLPVEAVIRSR